jgi:hypothetical protein
MSGSHRVAASIEREHVADPLLRLIPDRPVVRENWRMLRFPVQRRQALLIDALRLEVSSRWSKSDPALQHLRRRASRAAERIQAEA